MVHLAKVIKDSERHSHPKVTKQRDEDGPSASIYGSHYSVEHMSHHEMPEAEMPPATAYRMIKDELSLDGNPLLK